mmetsp:Transcript_27619/g.79712  ORF Transcript_27619/g.79712 Transcript_27619/m.79712 type:complete len:226 (-) Transcript_27619:508-1185(-)
MAINPMPGESSSSWSSLQPISRLISRQCRIIRFEATATIRPRYPYPSQQSTLLARGGASTRSTSLQVESPGSCFQRRTIPRRCTATSLLLLDQTSVLLRVKCLPVSGPRSVSERFLHGLTVPTAMPLRSMRRSAMVNTSPQFERARTRSTQLEHSPTSLFTSISVCTKLEMLTSMIPSRRSGRKWSVVSRIRESSSSRYRSLMCRDRCPANQWRLRWLSVWLRQS